MYIFRQMFKMHTISITCEEEELPSEEQKKVKRSERAITKINNEPSDELKELYKKTDMTFRNFHENEE